MPRTAPPSELRPLGGDAGGGGGRQPGRTRLPGIDPRRRPGRGQGREVRDGWWSRRRGRDGHGAVTRDGHGGGGVTGRDGAQQSGERVIDGRFRRGHAAVEDGARQVWRLGHRPEHPLLERRQCRHRRRSWRRSRAQHGEELGLRREDARDETLGQRRARAET